MKVRIKNNVFQQMLKDVNQVKSNATLPILSCIKIEADEKKGFMICKTDLQARVERTEREGVEVSAGGSCAIPSGVLEHAVNNMGEFVELMTSTKPGRVLLSDENVNYELVTLPDDDFPERYGHGSYKVDLVIPGSEFLNQFRDVWIACSEDDSRKTLQGVYAEIADEKMGMAATDGKRLCTHTDAIDKPAKCKRVIMPKRGGLDIVSKIMSSCEPEEVAFKTDEKLLAIEFPGCEITFKLVEGQYPGWRQIIPEKYEHEIKFDAGDLRAVVKAVSAIEPDFVKFSINAESMAIVADNPAHGHCDGVVPALGGPESAVAVSFQVKYLLAFLMNIPKGEVIMKFNTKEVSPVQFEYCGLVYLIMPMRGTESEEK